MMRSGILAALLVVATPVWAQFGGAGGGLGPVPAPIATTSKPGLVKPDGTTITVNGSTGLASVGTVPVASVPGAAIAVANYSALTAMNTSSLSSGALATTSGYATAGDGGAATYVWNATSTASALGSVIVAGTGGTGRWFLQVPANGVHPEAAGAACNYVVPASAASGTSVTTTFTATDDTTAFSNLSAYIASGFPQNGTPGTGAIIQNPGKSCYIAGPLTLGAGVSLEGAGEPLTYNGSNAYAFVPYIALNPANPLVCGAASRIRNLNIMRAGLRAKPTTFEQAYTYINSVISDNSVGISAAGYDCEIDHVQVIGFNQGVLSSHSSRNIIDGLYCDDANCLAVNNDADTSFFSRVRGYPFWTFTENGHLGAVGVTQVAAGAGYSAGNTLTVPGGVCATQPTLLWNGSALSIADQGDCTVTPQSWGAASATVYAGGTGGTAGTQTVTVSNSSCTTPPQFSVTVAGGAITSVNSVVTAGVCSLPLGQLPPQASVTGAGLSGATLLVVSQKNPMALTGGSGTGMTATINVFDSGYRPGTCLFLTQQVSGAKVDGVECEEYQIQAALSNVWNVKFSYLGGEGGFNNLDEQTVGILTQNCVSDVVIYNPNSDDNYIGLNLQHESASSGGSCSGASNSSANLTVIGGHIGFNAGYSAAAISLGAHSTGIIQGITLGWAGSGWPAAINVGASAGLWRIDNMQFDGSAPPYATQWIAVSPSATPPASSQFGAQFPGSWLVNGDMLIDQMNEGGASTASSGARIDRWRINLQSALTITTQRQNAGPTGYSNSLKITNGTGATISSAQENDISQRIDGPILSNIGWGTNNSQPVVMEWWAQASTAGTYNIAILDGGQTHSYVMPFSLAAANTWQYFSQVVPGAPLGMGTYTSAYGAINAFLKIDLGSGATLQASSGNQWQAGKYLSTSGSVELGANTGATLTVTGIHMRPGPFAVPYEPRDYGTELALAQRYYAKSFPSGTAIGQNKGSAGAMTLQTPVTSGSWGAYVAFPATMAVSPATITFYSTGAATANCYNSTKAADVGAGSAVNAGTAGFFAACSLSSGSPAAGDLLQVQWSADTGL